MDTEEIFKNSDLERAFETHLKTAGLPDPEREYKFHPTRKWRFDFAWPDKRVAVECEGGIWSGGRHTRGSGFLGDVEKYNEAARLGWKVFRVTSDILEDDPASFMEMLGEVMGVKAYETNESYT